MNLYGGQVNYIDVAVGGYTCTQRANLAAQDVDPHYAAPNYFNIVTFQCGINDYKQGTTNATTVYGRITSYVASRKAVGWKVFILTVEDDQSPSLGCPCNGASAWETFRASLNSQITGGAVANGYSVIDIASDATMGCVGCASNLTYFNSDLEHPTVAGYAIFATYLQAALTGIGFH
jgi:hypothetical protein